MPLFRPKVSSSPGHLRDIDAVSRSALCGQQWEAAFFSLFPFPFSLSYFVLRTLYFFPPLRPLPFKEETFGQESVAGENARRFRRRSSPFKTYG